MPPYFALPAVQGLLPDAQARQSSCVGVSLSCSSIAVTICSSVNRLSAWVLRALRRALSRRTLISTGLVFGGQITTTTMVPGSETDPETARTLLKPSCLVARHIRDVTVRVRCTSLTRTFDLPDPTRNARHASAHRRQRGQAPADALTSRTYVRVIRLCTVALPPKPRASDREVRQCLPSRSSRRPPLPS
jgi:hypothetical protein